MSAYLNAVVADSPVHYWRLADPGGGLAHDIGSSPFHLGAGTSERLGYSGPNSDGGSYECGGGAFFLSSLGALQSITSPFSVELWMWPIGIDTTNDFLIQWDGAGLPETQMVFGSNARLQFSVNNSLTNPVNTVTAQAWHHVVGTYSGATGTLYLDGTSIGTFALAGPVTIAKKISIGGTQGSASNIFQGWLSELAIYNSTLSASRVSAHFAAADNVSQSPIFTAASGLSGFPGVNTNFVGGIQSILAKLVTTYQNQP